MLILDLTLPLSAGDSPFVDANGYSDPPTEINTWIEIGERSGDWTSPFHVSKLQLSAHAGTHVDAPSHFHTGAPAVSDLPTDALAGRAVVVDLRHAGKDLVARLSQVRIQASESGVTPLILTPPEWLTPEAVDEVIAWNRPLIAFAGETDCDEGYVAVSRLLGAIRWIVGNLDVEKSLQVRNGDLLVVAPLTLKGIEGSPCRVLAIRG